MASNHVKGNTVDDESAYIGPVTAHEEERLQWSPYSNDVRANTTIDPRQPSPSTGRPVRFQVKNLWGGSVRVVLPNSFESMAYVCRPYDLSTLL